MKYVLFYVEAPGGENRFDWTWIDKWCGLYGMHPVAIDPEGHYKAKDRPPYCFKTLEDARIHQDLKDLDWVWCDMAGDYWDTVELPKDNVIYCVGHDTYGFGDYNLDGEKKIKIRSPNPDREGEWYASMVVPLLLFQVYS